MILSNEGEFVSTSFRVLECELRLLYVHIPFYDLSNKKMFEALTTREEETKSKPTWSVWEESLY